MLHDALSSSLSAALLGYGLDVRRFTPALAAGFLERYPVPERWGEPESRSALISTFAIGETTFLRHPEHFRAVRELLPTLVAQRRGEPLRAFSAGCASGEEAYSLAATLSSLHGCPYELMAWDVNPEAIARARGGEYRPWSLRDVAVEDISGWLAPAPSGVRVEPWLQQRPRFEVGNLHSDTLPTDLDLIFCRNVLLYFQPDAARRVLVRMAQALRPSGLLFLGHYDPRPPEEAGLVVERIGDALFYRKASAPVHVPLVRPRVSVPPPRPLCSRGAAESGETHMESARLLVNQGRHREALQLLGQLSAKHALRPELHVLTALAAEDAGDVRLMLEAARKACFLAPDQAGPNYFMSVAFIRNGELRRASLHRRIAASALKSARSSSDVLDFSEGLTVGQLRRLLGAIAR